MAIPETALDFLRDGRRNGRSVYKVPGPARYRPSNSFSVTPEDVGELRTLVRKLFNTPPQSADAAWARSKLVANLSGSRQTGTNGHYQFARSPVASNDLSDHVGRLSRAASLWFEGGEFIPPVLAERVQLFLRRSGHLSWEKAFLAVFCYHFAAGHDGRYDGLTRRAAELRVYPLARRATTRRPVAYRGLSAVVRKSKPRPRAL